MFVNHEKSSPHTHSEIIAPRSAIFKFALKIILTKHASLAIKLKIGTSWFIQF